MDIKSFVDIPLQSIVGVGDVISKLHSSITIISIFILILITAGLIFGYFFYKFNEDIAVIKSENKRLMHDTQVAQDVINQVGDSVRRLEREMDEFKKNSLKATSGVEEKVEEATEDKPKRKRGRPRKNSESETVS